MPTGIKRPRDPAMLAATIIGLATGEIARVAAKARWHGRAVASEVKK